MIYPYIAVSNIITKVAAKIWMLPLLLTSKRQGRTYGIEPVLYVSATQRLLVRPTHCFTGMIYIDIIIHFNCDTRYLLNYTLEAFTSYCGHESERWIIGSFLMKAKIKSDNFNTYIIIT